MILPIVCICGTNYDVDLEPVDGKVPGPVHCPGCGADSTAIVSRKLAQALAAAPPEKKPALVEEAPAPPTHCAKHPRAAIEIFCFVCKKPMCKACMRLHGFVCSPYCRRRGGELGLDIPVYEDQDSIVADRQRQRLNQITTAVGIVAFLLIGVWIWYVSFGSHPHVEFRLPLSESEPPLYAHFAGPHQVLLVTHWRATLYDVAANKQVWSVSLPNIAATDVHLTGQDIWLRAGGKVMRLDPKTGAQKVDLPIPGNIESVAFTDHIIGVVAKVGYETQLNRIEFSNGGPAPNQAKATAVSETVPNPTFKSFDTDPDAPALQERRDEFSLSGDNFIHLIIQLQRPNIVVRTTMKKTNSSGVSSELRMTESKTFAEDVLNDMQRQRTGGIRKVDESTYTVTIQRPGQSTADWSGELTGRPAFYSLATVNVMLAGQKMIVFDKANRVLWEAALAYEVDQKFTGGSDHASPCVEHRGSLFVFDRGVLTVYELRSGAVRWRLPSVGISKLTFDDKGSVYVSTTSAGLEAIQYADQLNFNDKIVPVILKVDAVTGKTIWRTEQLGDACSTSGNFLYFTRSQNSSMGMLTAAGAAGPNAAHFRVLRANPGNGKSDWEYYQPVAPLAIDFQDNRILLLGARDLQVLKFFSL